MLKMSDKEDKACPFLTSDGCAVYEDRPFSCRSYPMERAVARTQDGFGREALNFIAVPDHCHGHKESQEWSIEKWIENQEIEPYIAMNDLWVEIDTIFRSNPWGPKGLENPAFRMALTACYNIDKLKEFILESSFLTRFGISEEENNQIINSDDELLKFGFEWVKYFLTRTGSLVLTGLTIQHPGRSIEIRTRRRFLKEWF